MTGKGSRLMLSVPVLGSLILVVVLSFGVSVASAAVMNNIFTVAGVGDRQFNGDNQPANQAGLSPFNVAAMADGGFLIADFLNHRVTQGTPYLSFRRGVIDRSR